MRLSRTSKPSTIAPLRRAALDDPPAHDPNVVDGSAADNDPAKEVPALRPGARKRSTGKGCSRLSQIAAPAVDLPTGSPAPPTPPLLWQVAWGPSPGAQCPTGRLKAGHASHRKTNSHASAASQRRAAQAGAPDRGRGRAGHGSGQGQPGGRRDATIVLVAYRHGPRAAELVDLHWGGIRWTSERPPCTSAGSGRTCRLRSEAGVQSPPHMLRHACGYVLANKGHDTRALQAYLGGAARVRCRETRSSATTEPDTGYGQLVSEMSR